MHCVWNHLLITMYLHKFYSYNKSQQYALFLYFILVKNSTCFGQNLNTLFTTIGICHIRYVDCLLARSGSVLTSLAYRVLNENRVEKWCNSLPFFIRIYHGARSSEGQNKLYKMNYPSTLTVPQVSAINHHIFLCSYISLWMVICRWNVLEISCL